MKKAAALFISGLLIIMSLTACSGSTKKDENTEEKLQVVATIFPAYDWAKQIIGEDSGDIELTLLLNNGVDIHSYQPTVNDIIKITTCDMLIYVGGESDEWVEDALKQSTNPDMVVINLLNELGDNIKEEEIVEGMQYEHEHGDDHDHEGEDGDDHDHESEDGDEEIEYDEHVWLSLRNAEVMCSSIYKNLAELVPEAASQYASNAENYIDSLLALDNEYLEAISESEQDTLLFCDRFPFRYLVDDYGLSYFAAFNGCSSETDASFETVIFLANKIDELELQNVIVLETSDKSIAKTVVESTKEKNAQTLVLNSMQAITQEDISNGASYISVMRDNLSVIRQALA